VKAIRLGRHANLLEDIARGLGLEAYSPDTFQRSHIQYYQDGGKVRGFEVSLNAFIDADQDLAVAIREICSWAEKDKLPTYLCNDCGAPRTKAEGGAVFTICEECWRKRDLTALAKKTWEMFGHLDPECVEMISRDTIWRIVVNPQFNCEGYCPAQPYLDLLTKHDELPPVPKEMPDGYEWQPVLRVPEVGEPYISRFNFSCNVFTKTDHDEPGKYYNCLRWIPKVKETDPLHENVKELLYAYESTGCPVSWGNIEAVFREFARGSE